MISRSNRGLLTKVILYYHIWLYATFFRGCKFYKLVWDLLNSSFFIYSNFSGGVTSESLFVRLFRCLYLNTLCQFTLLNDIGVSQLSGVFFQRFSLVYILTSILFNFRLNVKVKIIVEQSKISISTCCLQVLPSLTLIYANANWLEREIWDMFGLVFTGHFDLRRLLTDYGFFGHPLLKVFPLVGTVDVFYSDVSKRITYRSTELAQSYRYFCFNKF